MSSFDNALESYWSLPIEEVFTKLQTKENGLTEDEVKKRQKSFGLNILAQKKQNLLVSFVYQFINPLIIILFFASLISALLREATNFLIINTIIVISGSLDFYQQHKAENAAEKLRQKVSLTASVTRNGKEIEIPVSQIVPGDIINLTVGDIVPADCRLIWTKELDLNQSALTGEAYPQTKNEHTELHKNTSVVDRLNTVFMGTNVISGEGKAIAVHTGKQTEIGQISTTLIEKRPDTEFQKQTKSFGFLLMKITFTLVIFVFAVDVFRKQEILDSFLFALALAIGLTPELLPLIITINLSKGAQAMSRTGVIVKDLPAIQNLGSMEVLCTDKTGTLTEDKISLEKYQNLEGTESRDVLLFGYLNSHHQTGIKNPLEHAILAHHEVKVSGYKKIDEIPFDFIRKRLSVVLKNGTKTFLISKGAPEEIFSISKYYLIDNQKHLFGEEAKKKIHEAFTKLSKQGFRVLAVAMKEIESKNSYSVKDEHELSLVGLMAFLDPAKQSASLALKNISLQGINLKILTGDNEFVTQKICQDLHLPVQGIVIGSQIDSLSDEALSNLTKTTTIFARVDPNQKRRIINAVKHSGKAVGFMGDGINDAPSLREADIGISVQNGVDVAKESADLILLHKDLNVLKEGVIQGRRTYSNIMKYIMMGTSSNFGNMFSMAGASILLPFLPMLPTQILLNNLLYDLSQLAIPTDNVDPETLNEPKKWNLSYIKHFMITFGPLSSVFDFLTFGGLWFIFKSTQPMFQTGWFIESLITQSLIIFSIRTRKIPFFKSPPSLPLKISALVICAIGLLLPLMPFASTFSFVKPPLVFYLFLGIILCLYFASVEITKGFFFKKYNL